MKKTNDQLKFLQVLLRHSLSMHLLNAVLLYKGYGCIQVPTLLVPISNTVDKTINCDVQKLSYRIYLQCASQMLCSFMSDAIVPQTKRCECLREMEMGIEWSRSIDAVLLYSLAIHLLNIVLLRHRPCYNQDRVWSMSVWNENDEGLVKV